MDIENDLRKVELRTHRVLCQLPLRPAPATIESRVWSEIARLAALPWWRKSFVHWPMAVRAAFLLLSAALGALTLRGSAHLLTTLDPLGRTAGSFAWLDATARAFGSVAHSIPTAWIYETCLAVALLYGSIFVLGAAAYRALYLDPLADGPGK